MFPAENRTLQSAHVLHMQTTALHPNRCEEEDELKEEEEIFIDFIVIFLFFIF